MTTSLPRRLTLPGALAVGLGSMVGAGVFTSLGLAALLTGGHVGALAAALVLAAVLATCNAVSTAQLAAVHPQSGGAYVYGRRQLGPTAGFLAGWGFVTGKTASVAAMATTAGLYLLPGSPWAARAAGVAAVVVLTAVSLRGITRTAQATVAILVPVLSVLALTIAAGLAAPRAAAPAGSLPDVGPAAVLAAAGVLFFAFAGYARVATMGEEVRDPVRTIPRAVLGALAVTVLLYGLLAWALVRVLGGPGLAGSPAPVRAALEATLGAGWGALAVAGAVLASAGAMLNLLTGVSRTALAMAREGDLPRPLAAVSARTGTPWIGQLAVAAAVVVLVLATDVLTIVGFSSVGVLTYYAVANLSALTLRDEQRVIRVPRAVNALGLVLCAVIALTLPPVSVGVMAGILLLGLAGRGLARTRRPRG